MLAATITVTTTKTSLYNLLRNAANDAAAAGGSARYIRPQEGFSEIRFQNDITGTDIVYIGDQNVASTNYAAAIINSATINASAVQFGQGADTTDLNTRGIFLVASANTPAIHVWIR